MGLLSRLRGGYELVGLGNSMVDYVAHVDQDFLKRHGFEENTAFHLEKKEQRTLLEERLEFQKYSGGSAANAVAAFANLGGSTAFIGAVANDNNGNFFIQDLKKAGIDTYVKKKKLGETGVVFGLITPGARTMPYDAHSAPVLGPEEIPEHAILRSYWLHSTGFLLESMPDTLETAMRFAHHNGTLVSFDIGSKKIAREYRDQIDALLHYTDVVFANDDEAEAFTGENYLEAANQLSKRTAIAIVKRGEEGSIIRKGEERHFIPAFKTKVVNTTGAGDAYAGAFLYAWFGGYDIRDAGRMASYYASQVVNNELAKLDYVPEMKNALR